MKKNLVVLFDLDGVLIDTEPLYDIFWKKIGEDYNLGIDNFEQKIKGTTLPAIMSNYFSHLPAEESDKIVWANQTYERALEMPLIPGALDFLATLKKQGIKMGLVTSSDDEKLKVVFEQHPLKSFFETIVSADRITEGKPHPMCYLLAAKEMGVNPEDCMVFEDSFHGIQAGKSAGMTVIGLSTTNSEESLREKVSTVIPDFQSFGWEDCLEIQH